MNTIIWKKKPFKICNCIKKKHKSPDQINLRLPDKYVSLVTKSEPTQVNLQNL
jgi:hypothetical protein